MEPASEYISFSVMSAFLWTHWLGPIRLHFLWNSPGKIIGVHCHSHLQRIYPTQGLNPDLLYCAGEDSWGSLDSQEIKPLNLKGNQSWIFIGKTDAEAETPILWSPDEKRWLTGKDLDTGKDWGQEEKRVTEDEIVGWHCRLSGHKFEQTPRVGEGQGRLVCCSLWGHKELDTTEGLNWTDWIRV